MYVLLLVVVLGLQARTSVPERPLKDHSAASDNSQRAAPKQADSSGSIGALPTANNVPNPERQQSEADKTDERRDRKAQLRLNYIYVWATVIGVIGGWGVLVVIIWQSILTRRSANAARTSADAVMNAERAWVIASPVHNAPELGFIPEPGHPPEYDGADTPNYFSVSFKNSGNTPARLIDSAVVYRLFNRLDEIPAEPEYGSRGPFEGLPLVKEDSFGVRAFLQPDTILTQSKAKAVLQQEAFLCAYGIVIYLDVFDRQHETRFGYIYHFPLGGDPIPTGFRRDKLPPAYNRAT